MSGLQLRRSALYLPASNARAIGKARTLGCDVIILDLEDSVAPDMKALARLQAVEAVGGFGGRKVIVRVNALDTAWGAQDLDALAAAACDGVLLPKIRTAADLAPYRDRLPGRTLWAMVETARSVFHLEGIAGAPGMGGLVFGGNDLVKELRCRPDVSRTPLLPVLTQMVAAARAFGIAAFDGVYNDIDDLAGFGRECRQAADLGFDGKTLIHPAQIEPCHAAFRPDADELAWAAAVRDAFALPENDAKGAIRLDGRMVERLHLEQAMSVLARAEQV